MNFPAAAVHRAPRPDVDLRRSSMPLTGTRPAHPARHGHRQTRQRPRDTMPKFLARLTSKHSAAQFAAESAGFGYLQASLRCAGYSLETVGLARRVVLECSVADGAVSICPIFHLKHLVVARRRIGAGRLEDVAVIIERISDRGDTVANLYAAPTDDVTDDGEEDKCEGGTYGAYAIPERNRGNKRFQRARLRSGVSRRPLRFPKEVARSNLGTKPGQFFFVSLIL